MGRHRTHLRCSCDCQLFGVQVPFPQLFLQHLDGSVCTGLSPSPPRVPPSVPRRGLPSSPLETPPAPAPYPDLQPHPSDDIPRVQHVPQGLAHLPALPVPNHGVEKYLGAWRGRQRVLREPVSGGPSGISGALGVRVGSESGNRNRAHGKHVGLENPAVTERDGALLGCYLAEGEPPCELGPQHDHAAHPEQQEVAARFQKGQGVETSEIWGLGRKRQAIRGPGLHLLKTVRGPSISLATPTFTLFHSARLTSWGQPREEKGKRAEENHVSRTSGSGKRNRKWRQLEAQLQGAQPAAAHRPPGPTPTPTCGSKTQGPPSPGTHPSAGSAPPPLSPSVLQLLLWPQPLSARPPNSPPCQPVAQVRVGGVRKNSWQVGNLRV